MAAQIDSVCVTEHSSRVKRFVRIVTGSMKISRSALVGVGFEKPELQVEHETLVVILEIEFE